MSRVAIIGAGAVGCYYGARLAEAGHEVHFVLRREYDAVAARGLHVHSKDGDFHLARPLIARSAAEVGPVDWVLCALKATALEEARELLAPCVGSGTRVLALMNGLGVEERFADWFGPARIFGGLAFTCINRGEPGHVHHLDYGAVTLGHLEDDAAELDAAGALWTGARVETSTAPSLLAARWQKLCWNIPFNGLAVTAGGITTDVILASPALRAATEATMREVVAAGNADLGARGQQARLDPDSVVAAMMSATDAMAAYSPSTMIDFVEGQPMEVEAIFGEPLRRAQALGVPVPHIALLTAQMRALDARRGD
ncbi:MAG: 2-dehydropantoate 2-reductase [Dehalococcoidia bacterium]|nr:2-dehydropantoate 2-reductase [Dehalococcoidia bacterium]